MTPEANWNPEFAFRESLFTYVKGAAMAAVIRIMPRIVPPPKTSKYAIAHLGLRIVANTSRAITSEPARPWTTRSIYAPWVRTCQAALDRAVQAALVGIVPQSAAQNPPTRAQRERKRSARSRGVARTRPIQRRSHGEN